MACACGQWRTFDLTIRGLTPRPYGFNVFAQGINTSQNNTIILTTVLEPETRALLAAGVASLGALHGLCKAG